MNESMMKRKEDQIMLNKYIITFSIDGNVVRSKSIFAGNEETALDIFRINFGPHPEAKAILLRPATQWEMEQIEQTGGKSPRKRNV